MAAEQLCISASARSGAKITDFSNIIMMWYIEFARIQAGFLVEAGTLEDAVVAARQLVIDEMDLDIVERNFLAYAGNYCKR